MYWKVVSLERTEKLNSLSPWVQFFRRNSFSTLELALGTSQIGISNLLSQKAITASSACAGCLNGANVLKLLTNSGLVFSPFLLQARGQYCHEGNYLDITKGRNNVISYIVSICNFLPTTQDRLLSLVGCNLKKTESFCY